MAEPHPELDELMRRVREGCPEAAQTVISVYGPHVLRVIRRRLKTRLRSLYDSNDFLQDVWADFFARWVHAKTFNADRHGLWGGL